MDLWVDPSPENARRVFRALTAFGAPLDNIEERTFTEPDIIYQIGVPPIRIDVLTAIDGVTFDDAWPNRVSGRVGAVTVDVLGRSDLLANKRASGRPKDLADIERLERDV